jgi:hypothetical protein
LNDQYQLSTGEYFTKGEAAKLTGVSGGELLDTDNLYGGIFGRTGYLFISEKRVFDGIHRYGSGVTVAALIDDTIKERRLASVQFRCDGP